MISSILQLVYCLLISILVGIFLRHKKLPDHDLLEDFLKVSEIDEKSVVFPVSMRLGADICARVNCKSFWWQPEMLPEKYLIILYRSIHT